MARYNRLSGWWLLLFGLGLVLEEMGIKILGACACSILAASKISHA